MVLRSTFLVRANVLACGYDANVFSTALCLLGLLSSISFISTAVSSLELGATFHNTYFIAPHVCWFFFIFIFVSVREVDKCGRHALGLMIVGANWYIWDSPMFVFLFYNSITFVLAFSLSSTIICLGVKRTCHSQWEKHTLLPPYSFICVTQWWPPRELSNIVPSFRMISWSVLDHICRNAIRSKWSLHLFRWSGFWGRSFSE